MSDQSPAVTLAKHGGISFFGKILSVVLGFLFLAIVTRLATPETYGKFVLALSVVLVLQGFDLNVDSAVDYFLPQYLSEGKYGEAKSVLFDSALLGVLGASVVGLVVTITAAQVADLLGNPYLSRILPALSLVLPLLVLQKTLGKYFNSAKKSEYRVLLENVTRPSAKILISTAFLLLGWSVYGLVIGYIAGLVAAVVLGAYLFSTLGRDVLLSERVQTNRVEILKYSAPLAFAGIVWTLVGQIDFILLGILSSPDSVGTYRVIFQFVSNMAILISVLDPIFKPMIAERKGDTSELAELYELATRWVCLLTIPVGIAIFISGKTFLSVLFTPAYATSSLAASILALGYLFSASAGPSPMVLTGLGYSRLTLLNVLSMVAVNGLFDILLIPKFGIIGAAIGTATALSLRAILGVLQINYFEDVILYSRSLARIWISGLITLLPVLVVNRIIQHQLVLFFLVPAITLMVFFGVLLLLSGFTEQDVAIAERVDQRIGHPVLVRVVKRGL